MTGDEAEALVRRMMAVWPSPAWPSEHFAEWLTFLEGIRFDVAIIAVEELKRSARRRPSFAEFQDQAAATQRQIAPPPAPHPELLDTSEPELPALDPEVALQFVAESKRLLAERTPASFRMRRSAPRGPRDEPRHVSEGLATELDDLEASC